MSHADLRAGVLKDTGDERHRSFQEENGVTNQAEFPEQDAGVQRQDQGLTAPIPQGTGYEWAVDAATVGGWILQPPTNAALVALGERGTGMDVGKPGGIGTASGKQQSVDHPGQRMCVLNVVPQPTLDVGGDGLVQLRRVPGSIFGCHRQNVSPTGGAFSYFVAGDQQQPHRRGDHSNDGDSGCGCKHCRCHTPCKPKSVECWGPPRRLYLCPARRPVETQEPVPGRGQTVLRFSSHIEGQVPETIIKSDGEPVRGVHSKRTQPPSLRPVLKLQARHPCELAGVVGD